MKEKGRCALREEKKGRKTKIFVSWCKHLPYQELISSGKISIGVPVNGGLLQAAFITVRFDWVTVWQAQG